MAQYDLGAKEIGWERRNKKAGRQRPARASAGSAWRTATGTSSPPRTWARRSRSTATARSRSSPATRTSAPAPAPRWRWWRPRSWGSRPPTSRCASATPSSPRAPAPAAASPSTRWPRSCASPRTRRGRSSSPSRRRSSGAPPEELDAANGKIFVAKDPHEVRHLQAGRGEDVGRDDRLHGEAEEAVRDLPRRPRGHAVRRGRGGHRDRRGPRRQDGVGERLRLPGEPAHRREPGHRGDDPGRLVGAPREPHPRPQRGDDGQPQPRVVQDLRPRRHVRGEVDPHPASPTSATTPRPRASASRRSSPPSR